jgi:hypothetical protein
MDTFTTLQGHWKAKHFEHLIYCLKYCSAYFEDHFEYQGVRKEGLMIDGVFYTQEKIIALLADYYDDTGNDYQSSFGDALYLFFTDLVEDNVDILTEIEEEVA